MSENNDIVYQSCYALDPKRRMLIQKLLPMAMLFASMAMLMVVALLYQNMMHDVPDDLKARAQSLFALLFVLIASFPTVTLWLCWHLNRTLFNRTIRLTGEGLIESKAGQERSFPWNAITRHRKVALGRMQYLMLYTERGKIKLDATMIEQQEPSPQLKMNLQGEYLLYPDEHKQRLVIEESPLYQEIVKRLDK